MAQPRVAGPARPAYQEARDMFKLFGFSVDAADSLVDLKDLIDTNDLDPLDLDP